MFSDICYGWFSGLELSTILVNGPEDTFFIHIPTYMYISIHIFYFAKKMLYPGYFVKANKNWY